MQESLSHGPEILVMSLTLVIQGSLDKSVEQRVPVPGGGLELGMELNSHKPGMDALGQLHHFGEVLSLGQG